MLSCRQTGEFPAISFEEPADLASAPVCRNSCFLISESVEKLLVMPDGCWITPPSKLLSGNAGATSRSISRLHPAPLRRWTLRPCGDRRGNAIKPAASLAPVLYDPRGFQSNFILLFPVIAPALSCYFPCFNCYFPCSGQGYLMGGKGADDELHPALDAMASSQ